MLSLKDRCMSATTNKPYVKSIVGGLDNSPEGNQVWLHRLRQLFELDVLIGLPISQAGTTHGFVVEFESAEDRDY